MAHLVFRRGALVWLAALALLSTGCASLQIDVDVYKGPLAHEPEIQVRQYASMASAAKPLLEELYCQQRKMQPNAGVCHANCAGQQDGAALPCSPAKQECAVKQSNQADKQCSPAQVRSECATVVADGGSYRLRTLCQALRSYDVGGSRGKLGLELESKGLYGLELAVTEAMARPAASKDYRPILDEKVLALNNALIVFAQEILYVANNELLFGADGTTTKETRSTLSVLQSLGNTILVHANDLQRQRGRDALLVQRAVIENDAVLQAFEADPSVTIDSIIARLESFTVSTLLAPGATQTERERQEAEVKRLKADIHQYLDKLAPLLQTYRTIKGEPPASLREAPTEQLEEKGAMRDRDMIAQLYANTGLTDCRSMAPLKVWLNAERNSSVAPARESRLKAMMDYLDGETGELNAVAMEKDKCDAVLPAIVAKVSSKVAAADWEASRLRAELERVQTAINGEDADVIELAALANQDGVTDLSAVRAKTVEIVKAGRAATLTAAEGTPTRDPRIIKMLLLAEMDKQAAAKRAPFTAHQYKVASAMVRRLTMATAPCSQAMKTSNCQTATAIDVVDNLIASLRAKRVLALSTGQAMLAEHLLKAINVAYEQRTAMIYLRPASDYLRSVYSSSSLQEASENEFRNMLFDWFKKYLNPFEDDEKNADRKELEKIHWQTVNRVTVSGGGFTNYVLAKDDVGNWYVKAYGSDPEAIIKSATSLALFNTGKTVDTNLLRRLDVQRQLDERNNLTPERRQELLQELGPPNRRGNETLLRVRSRYAERYAKDTHEQAIALLDSVNGLQAIAEAEVARDWPETTCAIGDLVTTQVSPLGARFLVAPRERLGKAVAPIASPQSPTLPQLEEMEKSIQAVLTAMHLYSSELPKALKRSKVGDCVVPELEAGERTRKLLRTRIVTVVEQRKTTIERYEDALSNLMDVASGL